VVLAVIVAGGAAGGLADHEAYVVEAGGHAWWTDGFARHAPALATLEAADG